MATNKAVTIKDIPESLWRKVRIKALGTGKTVSQFVVIALLRALEKEPRP